MPSVVKEDADKLVSALKTFSEEFGEDSIEIYLHYSWQKLNQLQGKRVFYDEHLRITVRARFKDNFVDCTVPCRAID